MVLAGLAAGQGPDSATRPARSNGTVALEGMLPLDSPVRIWLGEARELHPEALAALARVVAAQQRAEAVESGFYDPVATASAGLADGAGQAPGIGLSRVLPGDVFALQGGLEAPVGAGVYAGAGGAAWRLVDSIEGRDRWRQVLGVRARVPLLQDSGYALMRTELAEREAQTLAESGARSALLAALEREIVRTYVEWLQSVDDARVVGAAVERAEKLLEETTNRAALEVTAEYQVYPARLEVVMRREELAAARQQIRTRLDTLEERVARAPIVLDESSEAGRILTWAAALTDGAEIFENAAVGLPERPEIVAARMRVEAAQAALHAAREASKSDLSLHAGIGWDSDADRDDGDSDTIGYDVALVLRRPWGRSGERAKISAAQAELDARLADLAAVGVQVAAQVARARTAYAGSKARLELALGAVEEARRVLTAENERFMLGEGTSRNVLDAQKDLTSATRRHLNVAGQVVQAQADLRYALGQPFGNEGDHNFSAGGN